MSSGVEARPDLGEERAELLGLHGENDEVRTPHGVGVGVRHHEALL